MISFRLSYTDRLHASLIMLCLSILLLICFFIPLSLTSPIYFGAKYNYLCNIFGYFFHYFLLTSFIWMFILTSIQYMNFVQLFDVYISHFFIKASIMGWIIPLICPSLVLLLDMNSGYVGEFQCWINNEVLRYSVFITPILTIILCNLLIFMLIIQSVLRRDSTYQHNQSKLQIVAAFFCFVSISKSIKY